LAARLVGAGGLVDPLLSHRGAGTMCSRTQLEDTMETRSIVVQEVVSPGSVVADDGATYVLRGIPDGDEEFGNVVAARAVVEKALLGKVLLLNTETSKELPDLPGTDVEAFDADGIALAPKLAAKVAGALVNYPMR
jgi:hypothetical protein